MATYPTSVVSFTTKNAGDTIQPAHINDAQSEIGAIETSLIAAGLNSTTQGSFTWTPVLTFATPGNLAVTYSVQEGTGTKIGRKVSLRWSITTSAFTHTTASGALTITGASFTNANVRAVGSCFWQGITKANYTQVNPEMNGATANITFIISGSAQPASAVAVADVPTGGTVVIMGSLEYYV